MDKAKIEKYFVAAAQFIKNCALQEMESEDLSVSVLAVILSIC
jgi:hypothetical protein